MKPGLPTYNELLSKTVLLESKVAQLTETAKQSKKNDILFKLLIEKSSEITLLLDKNNKIIYANPSFSLFLGYTGIGTANLQLPEIFHPDELNYITELLENCMQNPGKEYTITGRQKQKTGNYVWYKSLLTNYLNIESINAIVLNYRDITHLKKAEEDLHTTEFYFKTLIENSPDGIVLIGKDGTMQYASPQARKMFNYPLNGNSFPSPNENTHPDDLPKVLEKLNYILENPTETATIEYRFKSSTNQYRWIESSFRNLYAQKNIESIIINFKDIHDRKLIEQALQVSNEQYRKLALFTNSTLDALPLNIAVLDGKGIIIYVNKEWNNFALQNGAGLNSVSEGNNYLDVCEMASIHSDDYEFAQKTATGIRKLIQGTITEFELEYPCNSPTEERWFLMRCTRLSENEPVFITIIHINITARKVTEEKLRQGTIMLQHKNDEFEASIEELTQLNSELLAAKTLIAESEARYRLISENAADVIWVLNPYTGTFTYVSPSVKKLRGYTPEEVMQQTINDGLTPESAEKVANGISKNLEAFIRRGHGTMSFISEIDQPCKNGKIVQTEVTTNFVFNELGKVEVIGVSRNITDRKRSELKLRESEQLFSAIFQSSPIGISLIDLASGKQKAVNNACVKIFGYTPDEILNKTTIDLNIYLKADDRTEFMAKLIEFGQLTDIEINVKRKNNEIATLQISAELINFNNEQYALVLMSDITQRKLAEQKILEINEGLEQKVLERTALLIDLNAKLEEANATKDKFFSIIAHDLKNPFNSILYFSDELVNTFESDNNDYLLSMSKSIKNSANNAYKLLENLLEWARSQTGNIPFFKEQIQLHKIIPETIDLVESLALNKKITLTFEIKEQIAVNADKNMIYTILRNLIINSIKYTQKEGRVKVSAGLMDNFALISVTDYGIGISPDRIEKLFKISEKVSTPGTEKETGTGLGLLLCKEFVEKNGGKIWVDSLLGQGSVFSFTIPLYE